MEAMRGWIAFRFRDRVEGGSDRSARLPDTLRPEVRGATLPGGLDGGQAPICRFTPDGAQRRRGNRAEVTWFATHSCLLPSVRQAPLRKVHPSRCAGYCLRTLSVESVAGTRERLLRDLDGQPSRMGGDFRISDDLYINVDRWDRSGFKERIEGLVKALGLPAGTFRIVSFGPDGWQLRACWLRISPSVLLWFWRRRTPTDPCPASTGHVRYSWSGLLGCR